MLKNLLKNHINFWNLTPVEKPLEKRISFEGWTKKPYPMVGNINVYVPQKIEPQDIDIERLLGLNKNIPEIYDQDMINSIGCLYPEAWMEAVIGCSIYASAVSCSSKPSITSTEEMGSFSVNTAMNSRWLEVMDEILKQAVQKADGNIAVRQLHLRGIIDMLAAYLGEENMCLSFYDEPELISELAGKFSDLHIEVLSRGFKRRPTWQDGYVSSWGVYAPGPIIDYQIDASSLLSPMMYEKYLLEHDWKILKQYPYSILHMHACGLHMIDIMLKINELKAIEITLERETGVWEKDKIIEACKKVQKASKALIINGELTDDELSYFKSKLDYRGLAIFYWNPIKKQLKTK